MSARKFRWLRWLAGSVLMLIVVLVGTALWLLGTASGSRFLINTATRYVPGELAVGSVEGALLSTLALDEVRFKDEYVTVDVARIELKVSLRTAFAWRDIDVKKLTLISPQVLLAESEPVQTPEATQDPFAVPELPVFSLPVDLRVRQLVVENFTLLQAIKQGKDESILSLGRVRFSGRMAGSRLNIGRLEVDAPQWSVDASGKVEFEPGLPAELTAKWQVRIPEQPLLAGQLVLSGTQQRYAIDNTLSQPIKATTKGVITAQDTLGADLTTRTAQLRYQLENGDTIEAKNIVLRSFGQPQNWQVELAHQLDFGIVGASSVNLKASGDFKQAAISSLRVQRSQGGRLEASGAIEFDSTQWRTNITLSDIPLTLIDPAIEGRGDIQASIAGGLSAADQVSMTIDTMRGDYFGTAFTGKGVVRYLGGTLSVDSADLIVGANQLTISGQVADTATLRLKLRADDLSQLWPQASGQLQGQANVSGKLASPAVSASLTASEIVFAGTRLASAEANVRYSTDAIDISAKGSGLQSNDQLIDTFTISGKGTPEKHKVSLTASLPQAREVNIEAAGGWAASQWKGTVSELQMSSAVPSPHELISVQLIRPVQLTVAESSYRVSELCLNIISQIDAARPSICLQGSLVGDQVSGELLANELPFGWLGLVPPAGVEIRGLLAGKASVAGSLSNPQADARITLRDVELIEPLENGERSVINAGDSTITANLLNHALALDADIALPASGKASLALRLNNIVNADSPLKADVNIELPDLSAVSFLLPELDVSKGRLVGTMRVTGSTRQPLVEADMAVQEAAVGVLPLGIELSELVMTARQAEPGELGFSGSARSGNGRVLISGSTSLRPEDRFTTKLNVKGDEFQLINLPDMSVVAAADLDVMLKGQTYSVTGQAKVVRANVTVHELPQGSVSVSKDAIVHRDGKQLLVEKGMDGTVDVRLSLSEDVRLAGFGLRTKLGGQLHLRQALGASVRGNGELRLDGATYKAYGQDLKVSRGRLIFNGPLDDPILDLRAEREARGYRVGIDIQGSVSAPSSTLFSQPALPQAEAFALLLTGRELSGASAAESSGLSSAALSLGLVQAAGIGNSIRDAVGLDTLGLDGSGQDGKVLAGKKIGRNIYLQYAYGLFDQVSTVLLRLQINKRLSLESSSGDTQSVDLVYSVGRER